jgi:hypothetical protein
VTMSSARPKTFGPGGAGLVETTRSPLKRGGINSTETGALARAARKNTGSRPIGIGRSPKPLSGPVLFPYGDELAYR